jgi:hypothetical protein
MHVGDYQIRGGVQSSRFCRKDEGGLKG